MINGKFYTGLPPRMMNRSNSQVPNRLESHFYWPDDTDTETATETRVRRRASLSLAPVNKPVVQPRHTNDQNEVNTKQMLHNQFSKSSIQFCDNINEEEQAEQRPFKRAGRKEITCKPTANKFPPLLDSDADTAAIKNKHMFESKLEFNNFLGEDKRNNMHKNKIDMNDKYEVERNTKNSPKLQNKRNVQNLIENIPYNSEDEEQRELQRHSRAKSMEFRNRNNKYRRDQTPKRIRHAVDYSDYAECRDEYHDDNEATDRVNEAFKHMQINGRRPILKKRVSYSEEEEEIPIRHYYKRHNDNDEEFNKRKPINKYKFVEHTHAHAPNGRRTQSSNNNSDQDQHFLENNHKMNNEVTTSNSALEKSVTSNNKHDGVFKHLRSSLCFHGGEIVGSDNETTSATSGATPQRRNARSSTQRVSVGLPD